MESSETIKETMEESTSEDEEHDVDHLNEPQNNEGLSQAKVNIESKGKINVSPKMKSSREDEDEEEGLSDHTSNKDEEEEKEKEEFDYGESPSKGIVFDDFIHILPGYNYECTVCKMLFQTKDDLIDHTENTHHDIEDSMTGMSFSNMLDHESFLDDNYQSKNYEENLPAVCSFPGCHKAFRSEGALKTHSFCHKILKECLHCDMTLNSATAVLRHIDRRHNPYNMFRFTCSYKKCSKSFFIESMFKKHVYSHTRDISEIKKMYYKGCGIPVIDIPTIMDPDKGPVEEIGEYPCDIEECAETFKTTQSLVNHQKLHKSIESRTIGEIKWWACPKKDCQRKYVTQKRLRIHLNATRHDIAVYRSPFFCLFRDCGERFNSKKETIAHMREIHWGNKKKEAAALKAITPKKPHDRDYLKCPICYVRYTTEPLLRIHIKNEHTLKEENDDSFDKQEPETSNQSAEETSDKDKAEENEEEEEEDGEEKKGEVNVFEMKMYKCSLCHSSYHNVRRLRMHVETKHENAGALFLSMIHVIDNDPESLAEVMPTTLARDSQLCLSKERKRIKQIKRAEKREAAIRLKNSMLQNRSDKLETSLDNSSSGDPEENEGSREDNAERFDESSEMQEQLDDMDSVSTNDKEEQTDVPTKKRRMREAEVFKCRFPLCKASFNRRIELVHHQNKSHEKTMKCPHEGCSSAFFSMTNLRSHINTVHISDDKEVCLCGKTGRGPSFKKHKESCGQTSPLHVCEVCGRVFMKKSSYSNHKQVHLQKSPANLKTCHFENCGKGFKTTQDLQRHINTHTGARPFECPYAECNKSYKQKPHLLQHLKTHQYKGSGPEMRPFPCQFCGYRFKNKSAVNKHTKKHCVKNPASQKLQSTSGET